MKKAGQIFFSETGEKIALTLLAITFPVFIAVAVYTLIIFKI